MERHLRAQFERLLASASDRADGHAADLLRARLAANVAEGLDQEARTASVNVEDDAEDLARAAAYLDGRLAGFEREAFLDSLAASPRRRADLASAAALLDAIEVEPSPVPAELSARAGSAFAARAVDAESARPMLAWTNRAIGWSLATLALLVLVPGSLVVLGGRVDWLFHSEVPPHSPGAPARLEEAAPQVSPATPIDSFELKADAPAHGPKPSDVARSAPEPRPCEGMPAARAHERSAGVDAENTVRFSAPGIPCPPPVDAADRRKMLDAMGVDSEHGAAAAHRSIPTPSAILPSAR
jgi:hypothetical protein